MPSNFNFAEYAANRRANDAAAQAQQQSASNAGGFNFQDFLQQRYNLNQVANQYYQQQGYGSYGQQQDTSSAWRRDDDGSAYNKWRQMNESDRFFSDLNQLTDTLSNGASEALGMGRWNPEEGFSPMNVARFAVNLPGQMLSIFPDAAVKTAEIVTGTPFSEADVDSGLIPDYELGWDQKAANLGYLGLDALSFVPGLGIEARAANTAARVIGRGARAVGGAGRVGRFGEAAFDVGREFGTDGIVKNMGRFETASALTNAGKASTASRVADSALDIGVSSLFEGAQEAGQTAFEDLRARQWDEGTGGRMLESAAWGALGGGLVSTGSNLASGISRSVKGPDGLPNQNSSIEFEREKGENKSDRDGLLTASARQRVAELQRRDNNIPGSSSLISTVVNSKMNLMQAGMGEMGIHAMLQADDDGSSLQEIADRFYTTPEIIQAIDKKTDPSERQKDYQALIDAARAEGKTVKVVVGRNPDTGLGTATFDLVEIFSGSGISMNRLAYMMFGGDVDGDKNQIHFGKGAQSGGYLTSLLKSAGSGASRLNADYITYSNSKDDLDYFNNYVDGLSYILPVDQRVIDSWKKEYFDSFDADGKMDLDSITDLFDKIGAEIRTAMLDEEAKTQGKPRNELDSATFEKCTRTADSTVAELMKALADNSTSFTSQLGNFMTQYTKEQQAELEKFNRVVSKYGDKYLRSGDSLGAQHFAQFAAELGYRISAMTNLGNPFFRQVGQVYYHSQKDYSHWFEGMEKQDVIDLYEELIALSFRLTEAGGDVENSIEGVWRISIQDRTLTSEKPTTKGGFKDWLESFEESYDDMVSMFNKAMENETTRSGSETVGKPVLKHKLGDESDPKNKRAALGQAFLEIFGEIHVEDVLDISEDHWAYGKTFNQILQESIASNGKWSGLFDNYEEFSDFWKVLLEQYGWKESAVGKRIESFVEKFADKINMLKGHITETTDANGNKVWNPDPEYAEIYLELTDAWNLVMDPSTALRLNLATMETFLDTRWGRALLSGDASKTKNALLSIYQTDKWQKVIDIATTKDIDNDEAAWNELLSAAEEVAGDSVLDVIIYASIKETRSLQFLADVTSLDISYEEKDALYQSFRLGNYGSSNLMAAAFTTDDSRMTVSAVSDRLKRADQKITTAMKKSQDYHKEVVEHIHSQISAGEYSAKELYAAAKEMAGSEYVAISADAIGSFVYSQRDIVKEMADKGTTTRSSDVLYQMAVNITQGGNMSFLDQIGVELGCMKVGDFQANRIQIMRVLFDPEAEIRVWDPEADGYAILTQELLYESFGIKLGGAEPNETNFLELLDKCPQIASVIAPTSLDIVSDNSSAKVIPGNAIALDKAVKKWVAGEVNQEGQRSEQKIRNQIQNDLILDPEWWGTLIASIAGIDGDVSLSETVRMVNNAINQHIDFMLDYASAPYGETFKLAKAAFGSSTYEDMLGIMDDVIKGCHLASKMSELTGAVNGYISNAIAVSALEVHKVLALKKDFGGLLDYDNARSEIPDVGKIKDIFGMDIDEFRTRVLSLAYAMINMAPSSEIDLSALIHTPKFDARIKKQIADKRQSTTDPATLARLDQLEDTMNSWGHGLSGLSNFVNGYSANTSFSIDPDIEQLVITDDFIHGRVGIFPGPGKPPTVQHMIDRCRDISNKYGKFDDFTQDAIDEIIEAYNNGNLDAIKEHYNNIIVQSIIQNLAEGSGQTLNLDAARQTLQARRKLIELGEQMRSRYHDQLETRHSEKPGRLEFPRIKFNYENTAISYMASSAMMNAKAGSVGSGIGIDGAMTKTLAAFAALPADFDCGTTGDVMDRADLSYDQIGWSYIGIDNQLHRFHSAADIDAQKRQGALNPPDITVFNPAHCLCGSCAKCTAASHSRRQPNINMISYALSELCNWMQEPRHLQAKKKANFSGLISEGITQRDDLIRSEEFVVSSSSKDPVTQIHESLLKILFDRRDKLANYWNGVFDEAGKDLPLSMEHAVAFANATTPFMEVELVDGSLVVVSVADLKSAATMSKKYPMLSDPSLIRTVKPAVLSLQEVSNKIMRSLCREYAKVEDKSTFTKQSVFDIAEAAYSDWSSYSKKLDLPGIVRGINAYNPSFPSSMTADANMTPKIRWNLQSSERLRRILAGDRDDSNGQYISPDRDSRERIIDAFRAADQMFDWTTFGKRFAVVSCTKTVNNPNERDAVFSIYNTIGNAKTGNTPNMIIDGSQVACAELFFADEVNDRNIKMAESAYKKAIDNNHAFIVQVDMAEKLVESGAMSEQALFFNKGKASGVVSYSSGEVQDFVLIDPTIDNTFEYYIGKHMKMATTYLHPDEITIAMEAPEALQLPDAGHYTRADYHPLHSYFGSEEFPLTKLLSGTEPISLVTTYDEIRSINPDDVDLSYYQSLPKNARIAEDALRTYVENFISDANTQNKTGTCQFQNDVQRDNCIGFVKQRKLNGFVYAPVFYTGSIPDTAETLYLSESRGNLRLYFSTNNLDYNGNEDQKLDLYGVAYKSVGRTVPPELEQYWGEINDQGFGVISSPEHMFDSHAMSGRVIQMTDSIVQNNLFFFTRKAGLNLLFSQDPDTKEIIKNPNIDDSIPDDKLNLLAVGDYSAWKDVASGRLKLIKQVNGNADAKTVQEANRILANAVREIQLAGGFPHLFFCARDVQFNEATGRFEDNGIVPRTMTFRMALKNFDRDHTLKLFALFDSRLCPYGLQDGEIDTMMTVFDRSGRMINNNSGEYDIDGNTGERIYRPSRVFAIIGPNYYTGQGTATGSLSRMAAYSDQHMVKRMMELGVYPPKIGDWINYMGFQVGIREHVDISKSAAERLAEDDRQRGNKVLDSTLYDNIAEFVKDPLRSLAIDRRREALRDIIKSNRKPIGITLEDMKTPYTDDPRVKKEIESAFASLNDAAGFKDARDRLANSEILELVRYEIGFTDNDGSGGWNGLTHNQVIASIGRMKKNLSESGIFIKGYQIQGKRGDIRVSMPLLPRGLSMRLMSAGRVQAEFGKGNIDAFIDRQRGELEQSLEYIKKIEDNGKRRALFNFADAVSVANGDGEVSGYVWSDTFMSDIIDDAQRMLTDKFGGYDENVAKDYESMCELNEKYIAKLREKAGKKKSSVFVDDDGNRHIVFKGSDRTIVTYILRTLSASRKAMGLTYTMMLPANITERFVNQGLTSIAMMIGQAGIGPYTSNANFNAEIRRAAVKDQDFKKLYAAYRKAELAGCEDALLISLKKGSDLDTAIKEAFKEKGAVERISDHLMDVLSGGDHFIEGQMANFLDRFIQRSSKESPWWHLKAQGSETTILEAKLAENPSQWFIDVMSGNSDNRGADMILARQCLNWAKRGDMAQKNIVSALFSELASRSAAFEFLTTAFISPYFQYSTNRMGRILQWVAPISSIHYLVTKFFTEGAGKNIPIGNKLKIEDLGLEGIQFSANLKEALIVDMMHLGPVLVSYILLGMAGAIEPPDDEDKWGNFKEWTILGHRIDVAWWLEDVLGLAMPLAIFGKSVALGKPRLDLLTNGIAYYLNNNPVTKIADVVDVLLDPMAELQQEYDKDVQGYAKAMGGAPSPTDVFNGKMTSFGLSFVSQFITPGFVRELYNGSLQFEPDYKRVFETDATGRLTEAARTENKTQYTTYQDAIVRKYTRNNPVMGLIADLVMQPTTGYLATEMPDRIIYDPFQMNSIEAFSLYEDPWTKKQPKSSQEQLACCLAVVNELQSKSVDQLYREGFILDYDTKVYVGKFLWDQIASLNAQWAALEQAGELDYYVAGDGDWTYGQQRVSELKQQHYGLIAEIKSLYYDKLWNERLYSPAQYNQLHTKWAQDDNGEWYATGYYPSWWMPVTVAPSETPGGYKYVMGREDDWQTQSIVNGEATGIRGLVPRDVGKVATPNIEGYSQNGTDTGHSDIYLNQNSADSADNSEYPAGSASRSTTAYPRSSGGGGGGGGYSRGGSSAPNVYAPSVSLPKGNSSRIMNRDRLNRPQYDYLRPDFETKGSREAYKRSDI